MIGRVLNNRYSLVSLLGEGGMAVVYEAEDLLLGRRVALKVLREQFASDPGFLARFQREARAAAGLSHPGIVAIHDVGSEAGTQYIVMELVPGRTLKQIIQEEAPLGAARIVELGRQICEGLEYARLHQIVHRDVKPHNILVTPDGRAKIADFGIAVALGASSLTQSGYVVGSAHYLSPEQARGEPTTAYSDLYSTGVVLYEMATGKLPFEGETSVVVALKQIQEAPVPPRRLNPGIPESLQSVILRAMAKEPAERFGSGAEMAAALVACVRAGLEATQPHQLGMYPGGTGSGSGVPGERSTARGRVPTPQPGEPPLTRRPGGRSTGAERVEGPRREVPQPGQRPRRQGSSGWIVLVVVFAAFLCTLGSIPLGIVAYSSGALQRFAPGLAATLVATVPPVPTEAPAPPPTPEPTPVPTVTPTPVGAPLLVGMSFPAARQQAQAMGIEVVIGGEAYDSRHPVASIVSQKPAAGTPMQQPARIEVVVSLGREMLPVPVALGDTVNIARRKLEVAGFRWKLSEEWSEQVPAGVVIFQNPAPGIQAERGSEVVLTASKGREKVPVPSLIGKPEAEAQDMIVKAGLTKTWVNYQDYTTVPPGHVISQDPKPEVLVEKGSTVYIAVRRPQPATPAPAPSPTAPRKS